MKDVVLGRQSKPSTTKALKWLCLIAPLVPPKLGDYIVLKYSTRNQVMCWYNKCDFQQFCRHINIALCTHKVDWHHFCCHCYEQLGLVVHNQSAQTQKIIKATNAECCKQVLHPS